MCTTTDYCREHGVNHAVAELETHPPTQAEAELFWSGFPCCAPGRPVRASESPAAPLSCHEAQMLRSRLTGAYSKPWVRGDRRCDRRMWVVIFRCCGYTEPDQVCLGSGWAHDVARRHVAEHHGLWRVPDDLLDELDTEQDNRAALDLAHNHPEGARS